MTELLELEHTTTV